MEKASEVVKHRTSEDSIPANVIDNMITRQVVVGSHPVVYLAQLIDRLSSEFSIPVLGVINPPKGQEASSGANFSIDGMAIFNKDKLIGYLDNKTTLGYQYIKGKADQVTIFVKLPNGSKISLGMIKSNSTIKTQVIDDEPRAVINITQESFLREMTGEIDVVKNPKIIEEIAKLQEEVVKDTVQETIRSAKEDIKADFIGMGEAIYRQHPKEFEKMKDRWKEKFLDLQIEVYVNAKVRDTGLLTKPVY
jgi:spore germination protein KC